MRHEHALGAWEHLVELVEIAAVSVYVKLIALIQSGEGNGIETAGHIPLVLIAEDKRTVLHEFVEGLAGVGTRIFPQVATVVDVAGEFHTAFKSPAHGIHRGVEGCLTGGAGDTRTMKQPHFL